MKNMKSFILLLIASIMLFAQEILPQEKSIVSGELPNGFKYSIVKNAKPKQKVIIRLYVGAGSIDEKDNQRGLAHLIEHMAFNGTRHFKKNDLIAYMESIGMSFGGDINANTGYERTVYSLSLPQKGDNLKKAIVVISDWADGLNFNKIEYNKEKDIVLEEKRLRNTVNSRLFDKISYMYFNDSKYAYRNPIGKEDIIKNSSVSDAKSFYDTWYRPEFMHLVVVGDVDVSNVKKMIVKNLSSIKNKSNKKRIKRVVKDSNQMRIASISDKELRYNSVEINYIRDEAPLKTVDDKRKLLIQNMVNMLFSMRAQEQLLKSNPKAMQIATGKAPLSKNRFMYQFLATYENPNGLEAINELYTLMASFYKYGFAPTNFELVKNLLLTDTEKNYKRLGDMKSNEIANWLVQTIQNDSVYIDYDYDFKITKKLLSEITLEELNQSYKDVLNIKNMSIIFKDTKGDIFVLKTVINTLKDAFKHAKDLRNVKKTKAHIINKDLKITKIKSKKFDKKLGIYSYELENGIKVDFRPNQSEKDILVMKAVSQGGYSSLKGKEMRIAKNVLDVVIMSAPSKLTKIELSKIMSDKQINFSLYLDRYSQVVYANCNTKDTDMMFELLYASITEPKVDDRVLKNIKIQLIDATKQAKDNPKYLFQRDIIKEHYFDNPELKLTSVQDIEEFDAKSILKVYNDKFANMRNFRFVISGDMKPKQIENMICKYLGNLPTKDVVLKYDPKPYPYKKGKVSIIKNYNIENKANIKMRYMGKAPYSIKKNLHIMIASNILSVRLRNLIREEKSGVYGISVNSRFTKELHDELITEIGFTCNPTRKDELIDAIYPAIDKFVKDGVTDKELANIKKMLTLAYTDELTRNNFWVDSIMGSRRFDTPLEAISMVPALLSEITKEDINSVAKVLFGDDLFVSQLLPVKGE